MEEVWKDINLSSLNDQTSRSMISSRSPFGGVMFQDFLGRPCYNNFLSSNSSPSSSSPSPSPQSVSLYASPAPPLTALSLSSRSHLLPFDHLASSSSSTIPNVSQIVPLPSIPIPPPSSSSSTTCFANVNVSPLETLASSSSLPSFGSKRFPDTSVGERRNKRMIKNRESAARSRARKQAYTNELKLKVDILEEENARLRRQQQQLYEAAASQQKKKSSLYRTSTAPF